MAELATSGAAHLPARGLKRLLREPLLHFLVAAMTLFVVYRAMNPETESARQSQRIVLTADDLVQLGITCLAQGRPPPCSMCYPARDRRRPTAAS